MEQFFVLQVRINLIQQSLVNYNVSDTNAFQIIAKDIVQIAHDVLSSNNEMIIQEHMPQINNLCDILNTKHPFTDINNTLTNENSEL